MDLKHIDPVISGMEQMLNKIYDLKDALIDKRDTKDLEKEYRAEIVILNAKFTTSLMSDENDRQIKTEISMNHLFSLISMASGISIEELLETHKCGKRKYVMPRQIHMAMLRKTFGTTLAAAASIYYKDHATVLHAIKTVNNLYHTDRNFREKYSKVFDHCIDFDRERTIKFLNS